MQKLKIGLVLPGAPGYSETFFYSKIKGLQDYGHTVILFVNGNKNKDFKLCPVVVAKKVETGRIFVQTVRLLFVLLNLYLKAPSTFKKFFILERRDGVSLREALEKLYINAHILEHQLDWLHFGFATMALRRENVAEAIGARAAVSFRGYDIGIYPLKDPDCYANLWKKVKKVHTISDDLYHTALGLGLSSKVPYQKITPAIKAETFINNQVHEKFSNPVKILTVGRLNWKKGLEYAIFAAGLLQRKGINFVYTIIGDGIELERLVFAANQLGIREKVHFLGKKRPDEVVTYMAESDIYLQPSIQEGFCNAVLEAQAAGMFCIVTDAEGLSENVLDGKTGWVVGKRNPEAIANKIEDVLSLDLETLRRIQIEAIERTRHSFNIEKQIQEFLQFYST